MLVDNPPVWYLLSSDNNRIINTPHAQLYIPLYTHTLLPVHIGTSSPPTPPYMRDRISIPLHLTHIPYSSASKDLAPDEGNLLLECLEGFCFRPCLRRATLQGPVRVVQRA